MIPAGDPMSFGRRLELALDARGSVCVGIDPHRGLLEAWDLPYDVEGLTRFADICVRAFGAEAAVVKPQSAFFEVFGSAGVAVLESTLASLRAAGALAVLDVKRGDIGSTMAAYAAAYLDPTAPLAADAITVSPYLGVGSLQPAFDLAHEHGRGVFVLALTSNPEGPQVQHAVGPDGTTVAQSIINELAAVNAKQDGLGSLGVVVGATIGDSGVDFSQLDGPYLVPGIGAQGGTAEDVRRIFGSARRNVLASVSREVLRHGPGVIALREAALRQIDEFDFLRA